MHTQNTAQLIATLCINANAQDGEMALALAATVLQNSVTSSAVCDLASDVDYYIDAIVRDSVS